MIDLSQLKFDAKYGLRAGDYVLTDAGRRFFWDNLNACAKYYPGEVKALSINRGFVDVRFSDECRIAFNVAKNYFEHIMIAEVRRAVNNN